MSGPGSVTDLIEELHSLDPAARDEAAEAVWRRYSCRVGSRAIASQGWYESSSAASSYSGLTDNVLKNRQASA